MNYKNILGMHLKELRSNRNVSQEELGKIVGVSKPTISCIENGIKGVSVELLIVIADYFNVSTDYLLGRTDQP